MADIAWDIRRAGRAWRGEEAERRWNLTPEKMEMTGGKRHRVRSGRARLRVQPPADDLADQRFGQFQQLPVQGIR